MDWTMVTGAVLGSGLTLGGVWLTARQRERADLRAEALAQRAEWGRRLQFALAQLSEGVEQRQRHLGRILLESLVASSFATDEDRELAGALLADLLSAGFDLPAATVMDATGDGRHNEEDAGGANR